MKQVNTKISVAGSRQVLSEAELKKQNQRFRGSKGISQNNREEGFVPAFHNRETGEVAMSCFANGLPAPVHMIEGLPKEWALELNAKGHPFRVSASVIAGFFRDGRFFTREQVSTLLAQAS